MLERAARIAGIIGSPAYPADPEELKARAIEAFERSFYPVGVARQMVAAASHGNRKPALSKLDIPALVIHGRADPLVPVEGGIDTHEALRGSQLMVIDGMGHDLPRQVWPQIVAGIAQLTSRRAESRHGGFAARWDCWRVADRARRVAVVPTSSASEFPTTPGAGVELTQTPFFPQQSHQCGPAALATALGASGVDVTPDDLVPQTYTCPVAKDRCNSN